jgi:hypothetical protein
MQLRGSAVLVGSLLALSAPGGAAVPRTGPRIAADTLTAMPASGITKPLRAQRQVTQAPVTSAAWRKLTATGRWQASWDRATGVPSRIWGSGLPAPGASASAMLAEAYARAALAEYIAMLAPGATPDDFQLAANHTDGELRSVGFVQTHGGRAVVGGQVSFRFKRDRLFVIASEALPNIALPAAPQAAPRVRMTAAVLQDRTTTALRRELALPAAPVSAPGDEVILPLVADDAVLGYRVAVPVTIDGGAAGRYLAYADAATGETLAVRQMNLFASPTGTLLYHGVDRYPARPRIDRPAALAHVTVGATAETTAHDGTLALPDTTPQTVTTAVTGDLVAVVDKDSGTLATTQLPLTAGGQAVWDPSAVPESDAQVQVYLNVNTAKDFARTLDPGLALLDAQITANVNLPQDCNAFFDGMAVNFFQSSAQCQNTGLIQDVVFHEFGHAVHTGEIIPGVGAFDGAMSEGVADFLAVQITGDHGMGRGFFYTDDPLRDLDPPDTEARWPEDIGEIHQTGMIIGGALWDLRKALIAELGEPAGILLIEKLYIGALRRSVDIPSSLIEVLATDDDDGDLSNGTPHECEIRAAYGRHGLRTATGSVDAPTVVSSPTAMATVTVTLTGLNTRCAASASGDSDAIDHTDVIWKPMGSSTVTAGSVIATASADLSMYSGQVPVPTDSTLLYQVHVSFKDGSGLTLPDNLADPFYELYEGPIMPLYCTTFEDGDPLAAGWTTGTTDGSPSPWVWGTPTSGATDPHAAFSGTHALVQVLDGDYAPKTSSFVKMPPVDIGQWSDVHLQYRRWLAVEDSHFDQAVITVGGNIVWQNASAAMGDSSALQHIDREWRFQDVALSGHQPGHTLNLGWMLTSDEGLQFGGWALDDVCVVANTDGVCGDGRITAHEGCDDGAGNADAPNACRTWCQLPSCGDGIVDDGEQCDPGPTGDAVCDSSCKLVNPPASGGCCQTDRGGAGGALGLGAVALGLVLRRRRRARR